MVTLLPARPRSLLSRYASRPAEILSDLNAPALWAGLTTFIWYAVGLVPVQLAVTGQFHLTPAQTSSWICIIWVTSAIASIGLSLVYRQPIPITSSIPGLVFLGTLAGRFSVPELVGANLLAGLVIVALGVAGIGGRILRWLPMPLAMGMLAGSILGDVTHMVSVTVEDAVVAGATVVGYLAGRALGHARVPPVGLALLAGGVAVALTHRAMPNPVMWSLPTLALAPMHFSLQAALAVSLPLIVLSVGLGNVQGLGFLASQGFRVPVDRVTLAVGLGSIVNACFGGHTAIVSRNGMPILAGPEAGPMRGRYWASLIASGLSLIIALAAVPIASLFGILPKGYVIALAGLAILPSLQNALGKAFGGTLQFGAVVAFVVAATPFSLLGITSAFWAVLAGLAASLLGEWGALIAFWKESDQGGERRAVALVEGPELARPSAVAAGRPWTPRAADTPAA